MQKLEMRYPSAMIILHWLIAFAIIAMLISGTIMTSGYLAKATQFQLYQYHKASGVIVLLLVSLRVIVRVVSATLYLLPPLPIQLASWEVVAAKIGHYALYAAMLIMPLSGWTMVSASSYGIPTIVFGLFTWPHIPGLQGNNFVESLAQNTHEITAYLLGLLLLIHVLAVVKHYWYDRINLLQRMWWTH